MTINNYKVKISRLSDKIFDNITSFFQGPNSISQINDHVPVGIINPETEKRATYEWELNQGTADILINDMSFIYNHLVPERLIIALQKLYRQVQLYFLLDEEEILPVKGKTLPATDEVKARILVISVMSKNHIQRGTLSLMNWVKIRKTIILRRIRRQSQNPVYYLLGNFNTPGCEIKINQGFTIYKNHNDINFSLPLFHYLRN